MIECTILRIWLNVLYSEYDWMYYTQTRSGHRQYMYRCLGHFIILSYSKIVHFKIVPYHTNGSKLAQVLVVGRSRYGEELRYFCFDWNNKERNWSQSSSSSQDVRWRGLLRCGRRFPHYHQSRDHQPTLQKLSQPCRSKHHSLWINASSFAAAQSSQYVLLFSSLLFSTRLFSTRLFSSLPALVEHKYF